MDSFLSPAAIVRGSCVHCFIQLMMFYIAGRFMFSAIAVAILVGGPVTNITNNASEMASVSSCAANLLANQTELIRQLAQEPYDQFVAGLYALSLCNVVAL